MSKKVVELVNEWHKFSESNPKGSIHDFCRLYLAEKKEDIIPEPDSCYGVKPLEAKLSKSISRVSKFLGSYIKKAGSEYGLDNREDFQFLLNVDTLGSPSKTDLMQATITDFTSGVEVIKRLKKNGFVQEFPDERDKRAKCIKITPKGKETLDKTYAKILSVAKCVYQPLDEEERKILLYLLHKLDKYHTELYQDTKNKTYEEVFGVMVNG